MRKATLGLMMLAALPSLTSAQRMQQKLGRAVVAVTDPSGSNVLVTWRKLAQEPENCTYNIYTRTKGGSDYKKINATPITKTNYQSTRTAIPYNTEIAVTTVSGGVESEKSNPFLFEQHSYKDVFFDFNFETAVLTPNNYKAKYAWPMDLNGNGEFDAILVDRLYCGDGTVDDPGCTTTSHKLQAYKLDGTCLWTVDVGPNIELDGGQNDMALAYDINCDGRCEVIIKSSDLTRFWDAANNTWGKYANGSSVADTDGDGIADYTKQTKRNPPFYVSVIDGRTGEEIDCSELNYSEVHDGSDQYSRDNRSDYMNDGGGTEYAFMGGHFAICYFDGIHPSLAMECLDRDTNKTHHNYVFAWGYDWNAGKPSNWHHYYTWSRNDKRPWPAEFHQLRVADVDGDGIDEMMQGGYAVNPSKGMVMSAGIEHGDRYDVSDIDPDRPGMEVFAIQQSSLMGQVIYDAKTGEHIKEWYLPSVYDVGRGRCMDVDAAHKGYEAFSLLGNLYDCKGNVIKEGSTAYPYEASWWDGDLQRELIGSPGGQGYGSNVMINKYNGTRLIQFSRESSWAVHAGWAVRPAFMGDITGDWREEIVLMKQKADSSTGLVGYSTDIATDYSLYTLQEDPHYRLDCTTRGYYQAPCTSFYLGGDMAYPPLPPTMVTDLRWAGGGTWSAGGSGFTTFDQTATQNFADGKTVVFDVSGDNTQTISLNGLLKPKAVYLMAPSGHDYTFGGDGTLAGDAELWKSMLGKATFNTSLAHTGKTVVSEGTLEVNGTIAGPVDLRAKGTLAGVCTLGDSIAFEEALNYEGCRLMPGNASTPYGTMTFAKSLTLPGGVYIEVNAAAGQSGSIKVKGDLTLKGTNTITVNQGSDRIAEGSYVIAECTGKLTADISKLKARGLDGINYDFTADEGKLTLVVHGTRNPLTGVTWTGTESNEWNYKSDNFKTADGNTPFVSGDEVTFNDQSGNRNITVSEMMVTAGVTIDTPEGVTYTFTGDGGISGEGPLTKTGAGEAKLQLKNSDYTGATHINGGTLSITSIENGGTNSCLGAAAATAGNLNINGGTLKLDADNASTDRIITLTDTATINVVRSSLSLKGQVRGTGYLVKDGAGQLNFTYGGANTFAGLILKKGTVSQGAWNSTFGKTGGNMTLAGGTVKLIENKSMSTIPEFNYATTVEEGTSNTIQASYRSRVKGSFKGKGELTIISDGVRGDISANFSQFEGKLNVQGSNFRLMSSVTDIGKAEVEMAENSYMGHHKGGGADAVSATTKIGSLASTKDCTLGNSGSTFEVGSLNTDATFKGTLKAKTVRKVGTGKWTLSGSETGSSTIEVLAGTLMLNNNSYKASAAPISTGGITVKNGGTLTGNGWASAITVQKGGVLSAVYGNAYTTLKASGNVILQEGSTVLVNVKSNANSTISNSKFKVGGSVNHKGDTLLISVDEDCKLEAGTEITIFNGTGKQSGTYVLKTVSPGMEITWDDSQLLSDGILRVASVVTDGIQTTLADNTEVDVYTTDGIKLRDNVRHKNALDGLPKGVYLVNGHKIAKK